MRGGAAAAAPAAVARETGNATAKAAPAAEKTAAQQAAAKGASAGAARAGSGLTKAESAGLRQLFGNSNRGSKQLLGRLTGGEKVALPPGVTSQTLRTYREIAVKSISQGKDTLGVQAARKEAIDALLKQQTPK
jgi:hypothetical protein